MVLLRQVGIYVPKPNETNIVMHVIDVIRDAVLAVMHHNYCAFFRVNSVATLVVASQVSSIQVNVARRN